MPPAPPTFSTITDCPSTSPMRCANSRPGTSFGPPAAKGLIMVSVRVGKSCADAEPQPDAQTTARQATTIFRIRVSLYASGRQRRLDLISDCFLLRRRSRGRQRQVDCDVGRALQHHDAVADLQRLVDRMGDEDGGLAVIPNQLDEL